MNSRSICWNKERGGLIEQLKWVGQLAAVSDGSFESSGFNALGAGSEYGGIAMKGMPIEID